MPEDLVKGFAEFRRANYEGGSGLMPKLVENGQSPKYFMISCIDSRANPGTIFNALPGTFFAHKAMGAIVRPYQKGTALSAGLQFALNYNEVKTIVVLGHTGCGAIQALAEKLDDQEITSFIDVAKTSLNKAREICQHHDEILAQTEREVVLQSAENLKSYPSVAKALEENRVEIKAWMFDMGAGALLEHDPETDEFKTISKDVKENA